MPERGHRRAQSYFSSAGLQTVRKLEEHKRKVQQEIEQLALERNRPTHKKSRSVSFPLNYLVGLDAAPEAPRPAASALGEAIDETDHHSAAATANRMASARAHRGGGGNGGDRERNVQVLDQILLSIRDNLVSE